MVSLYMYLSTLSDALRQECSICNAMYIITLIVRVLVWKIFECPSSSPYCHQFSIFRHVRIRNVMMKDLFGNILVSMRLLQNHLILFQKIIFHFTVYWHYAMLKCCSILIKSTYLFKNLILVKAE